ncbi:MAG: PEP-CTERM sorting domain-containing protein [Planctomyces sp.]|jgi:hypothetical protein
MSVLRTLAALLLATSCCSQVLADPITLLQAENLSIIAGNSGQIRIFWETPDPVGINYLQTEFILTPVTGAAGGVSFAGPSLPPFSDSTYIYAGNSWQQDYYNNPPPNATASNPATVYMTNWSNDTYDYNDSTLNGANAPQDGTRLWTILDLSSIAGTSGTYQLTVGSSEYDYSGNTLGPIPILTSDLSGGLITVTAGGGGGGGGGGPGTLSAVPEPGSLAVMAAVIGGLSLRALRRRQQSLAA